MNAHRIRWLLAGLLLAVSGLAGPLAAQAPDGIATYSLDWVTVDGGGASFGSGGLYLLGGTIGQPDAAAPRTAGAYALRAGFWRPACTATVVTVGIALSGDAVTLSWTPSAANEAYQVHRGTTPYFAPSDATRQDWVAAGPWTDPGSPPAVGDPNLNYYYLLRPTCGVASVDAGRVGEFDFALVPGQ